MPHVPVAAVLPLLALAIGFVAYCLVDLVRLPRTRGLPKPVWAVLILISIPLGGIVYLIVGRSLGGDRPATPAGAR